MTGSARASKRVLRKTFEWLVPAGVRELDVLDAGLDEVLRRELFLSVRHCTEGNAEVRVEVIKELKELEETKGANNKSDC